MNKDFLFGLEQKQNEIFNTCNLLLKSTDQDLKIFEKLSIIPTFIFYGPSGSGKSTLARNTYKLLAQEHNIELYFLDISTLISSEFGQSSKNLESFFKNCIKSNKENNSSSFIILDELDSFATSRSSHNSEPIKRILLAFNNIIDNLIATNSIKNIIIIATTNLFDQIDPSICRRFYFKHDFNFNLDRNNFLDYLSDLEEIVSSCCSFDLNEKEDLYERFNKNEISLGKIKQMFAEKFIKFKISEGLL